jgi:hypothetical protein
VGAEPDTRSLARSGAPGTFASNSDEPGPGARQDDDPLSKSETQTVHGPANVRRTKDREQQNSMADMSLQDEVLEMNPGLHPHRLAALMRTAIERCQLDLSERIVLTEAATGAYVVTPILAAMAGASHVYALTCPSRHGTVEEVKTQTFELADLVKVSNRIEVITEKSQRIVSQADVVTNSGHVRPINASMIAWMKPTSVIPLMYEAWEFRADDVDLVSCQHKGIRVGGTNERHPAVDVFSFLGVMAIKLLVDAGIAVYASRILLLCDNSFGTFIERSLVNVGASVETFQDLAMVVPGKAYDAIIIAIRPRMDQILSAPAAQMIAEHWPGAVVAQFWGDLDRSAFSAAGVPLWPLAAPLPGHMGILPSAIGPEPIVRLQSGGLKVAEVLSRSSGAQYEVDFVDVL